MRNLIIRAPLIYISAIAKTPELPSGLAAAMEKPKSFTSVEADEKVLANFLKF